MHLALAFALLAAPPPPIVDATHAMDGAPPPVVASPLRPPASPALTVAFVDSEGLLSDEGINLMKAEVRAVFRELGVDAQVVQTAPGLPIDEVEGVVVPVIARRRQPRGLSQDRIMGLVLRDHALPSPVWVFVDNVGSTLGRRGGAAHGRELGISVGRVVAHEVIHALTPGHPHSRTGLMAGMLGRAALLGPRPLPEPSCARWVAQGLAILRAQRPPVEQGYGGALTSLR
jgi:hypothetical protein